MKLRRKLKKKQNALKVCPGLLLNAFYLEYVPKGPGAYKVAYATRYHD